MKNSLLSVSIVHGQYASGTESLSSAHSQYLDACSSFREIVLLAFKELNIAVPNLTVGGKLSKDWQKILDVISTEKLERKRFMRFLKGDANLTPRSALYFKVCRALGISPDEAGFNYEIIRPELIK